MEGVSYVLVIKHIEGEAHICEYPQVPQTNWQGNSRFVQRKHKVKRQLLTQVYHGVDYFFMFVPKHIVQGYHLGLGLIHTRCKLVDSC
jgi:hypothetical protein